MKGIRRKEKEITNTKEIKQILQKTKYITIAMCLKNMPYLVTLSHGYDPSIDVIYFHCAQEGKKIDILKENNVVWGQALLDYGYQHGACNHLYATVQFKGKVEFIVNIQEKRRALTTMIEQLEDIPEKVVKDQLTEKAIERVMIGKIHIEHYSGKKSKEDMIM